MNCRFIHTGIIVAFLAILIANQASGAPAARLWPYWQTHDPDSRVEIDHTAWDNLLNHYVDARHPSGIYRFHYGNAREQDKHALQNYLKEMEKTRVTSLNRSEQQAYWINLYNALTVHVILSHYPVQSIRDIDISPGIFKDGPWDAKLLKIEGQDVSLNDIEHRILRPIWRDNRIHYAVNCASLGCPNLQPQAYTADNLEILLEKGAAEFINHPRGVKFMKDKLQVSSIYIWFREDFGNSDAGIKQHLEKYLADTKADKLKTIKQRIKHQYNWDLNE